MIGDFWAQNIDVLQPGAIAPWLVYIVCCCFSCCHELCRYQRYGHSLDAVDINGDGVTDVMIMLGGFASNPSNDQWVSPDGNNWMYGGDVFFVLIV